MCNINTINQTLATYAEYRQLEKQAKKEAEKIKAEIIAFFESENIDSFSGVEHSATYKPVKAMRFDSKAFEKDFPDIYTEYKKESISMRFDFR